MPSSFEQTPHPFTVQSAAIDYFKLTEDHFKEGFGENLTVTVNHIQPTGDYLREDACLSSINLTAMDTTLFNFQAGQGKTELFHDYIKEYVKLRKYIIIYCAPFKRLLKQNEKKLKNRGLSVYNFHTEPKVVANKSYGFAQPHLTAQVLLMTPEFLVGNGGKEFVPQASRKEKQLSELIAALQKSGRKIILFIDEIHEETASYQSSYLPRLYELKPVIQKIFIASATFTREAIEATKAISLLTRRKIVIYQADRKPQTIQAALHLHVCTGAYSPTNLSPLRGLAELLKSVDSSRGVHISTAHRKMTDALMDAAQTEDAAKSVQQLKPNVLTGNNNKQFDQTKNSIGTTFRTGVNIEKPAVLIIILPGVIGASKGEGYYGTFSDGINAIVQSLARLRKGGEIHIFMPPFQTYIDTGNVDQNRVMERLIRALNPSIEPSAVNHDPEEDAFGSFKGLYKQKQERLDSLIKSFEQRSKHTPDNLSTSYQEHIGMKSFHDFVLYDYTAYRMAEVYSQGKDIIPVLFYQALRNGFVSCHLTSIQHERCNEPAIHLGGKEQVKNKLITLLSGHLASLDYLPPFDTLKEAITFLDAPKSDSNRPTYSFGNQPNTYKKPVRINDLMKKYPAVAEALLAVCFKRCQISVPDDPTLRFKTLVDNATADSGEIGSRYYAVQTAMINCQRALTTSVIGDAYEQFLKAPIEDNILPEQWAILIDALNQIRVYDLFYEKRLVKLPLPGGSLQAQAQKLVVADWKITNKITPARKLLYNRPYLAIGTHYHKLETTTISL